MRKIIGRYVSLQYIDDGRLFSFSRADPVANVARTSFADSCIIFHFGVLGVDYVKLIKLDVDYIELIKTITNKRPVG